MANKNPSHKKAGKKAKPGPKTEILKLEGDWKDNNRRRFQTANKPIAGQK